MALLISFSLGWEEAGGSAFEMHRLVQLSTRVAERGDQGYSKVISDRTIRDMARLPDSTSSCERDYIVQSN